MDSPIVIRDDLCFCCGHWLNFNNPKLRLFYHLLWSMKLTCMTLAKSINLVAGEKDCRKICKHINVDGYRFKNYIFSRVKKLMPITLAKNVTLIYFLDGILRSKRRRGSFWRTGEGYLDGDQNIFINRRDWVRGVAKKKFDYKNNCSISCWKVSCKDIDFFSWKIENCCTRIYDNTDNY